MESNSRTSIISILIIPDFPIGIIFAEKKDQSKLKCIRADLKFSKTD